MPFLTFFFLINSSLFLQYKTVISPITDEVILICCARAMPYTQQVLKNLLRKGINLGIIGLGDSYICSRYILSNSNNFVLIK